MVILDDENIFSNEVLKHIKLITDSLKQIEGISSVTSLTNTMQIKESEDGIEIGKLVDEYDLPDTRDELNKLKQDVLSNEMYRGTIVSEDGTATVIIFTLADEADIQTVAKAVEEKTEGMQLPEKIYYAGSPMMITSIARLISADMKLLFPIALSAANDLQVDVLPFVMAIMVAASASFATPIGYQTNLMVYTAGGYRFSDFLRIGLPLNVVIGIASVVLIPLIWSF